MIVYLTKVQGNAVNRKKEIPNCWYQRMGCSLLLNKVQTMHKKMQLKCVQVLGYLDSVFKEWGSYDGFLPK